MARSASLELRTGGTIHVTVPAKVDIKEMGLVTKSLIDLIHKHTGCTCLSGVHPVVLHDEGMAEVVRVSFPG